MIQLNLIQTLFICTLLFGFNHKYKTEYNKSFDDIFVTGQVIAATTGESLPYATIRLSGTSLGFITNEQGNFSIRIDSKYENDTLVFSYVGFSNQRVPIKSLDQEPVQIRMQEAVIDLEPVEVVPEEALEVVKKSIKRIGQNYQSDSVILNTYYREAVKINSRFVQFADAYQHLYYTPYASKGKLVKSWKREPNRTASWHFSDFLNEKIPIGDHQQLVEVRKSSNWQQVETIFRAENLNYERFDIPGAALRLSGLDLIKTPDYFLDVQKFKYYQYEIEGFTEYDGHYCYKLSFKPKKRDMEKSFLEGSLIIDTETYAILSLEYRVPESHQSLLQKINRSELQIFASEKEYQEGARKKAYKRVMTDYYHQVQMTYREFEGKWHLSSIMKTSKYKNTGSHFKDSHYETRTEMFVSSINSESVVPFSEENRFHGFLFHHPAKYNPKFWQNFNIIVPVGVFGKALEQLDENQKLEEQFGKN